MNFPSAIAELKKLKPSFDSDEANARLTGILNYHIAQRDTPKMSDAERQAAYRNLNSAIGEAHKKLSQLIEDDELGPLARALNDGEETDYAAVATDASAVLETLRRFERWTALAVKETAPADGRPEKSKERSLVCALAHAYEEFTRRDAGTSYDGQVGGPFVRFVTSALRDWNDAHPHERKLAASGDLIKDSLARRKSDLQEAGLPLIRGYEVLDMYGSMDRFDLWVETQAK